MTTDENSPKEDEKKEELPPNLYKYRSFSSPYITDILDGIAKDEIYFSCPTEFNDPCEGTIIINDKISNRGKYSFLLYSLSANNDIISMWSHYSNSHKGFCIEYNNMKNSHDDFDMQKVSYKTDVPQIHTNNIFANQKLSVLDKEEKLKLEYEKFIKAYYTKSTDWEYENEWRLRYYPIYGHINIFIYCIFYDTFSTQPEKTAEAINNMLKEYVDSDEVVKNDEKYIELRSYFLTSLNSSETIKDNETLHENVLNLLSYLYNKQNNKRNFELKDCGLTITAIYLGLEVENNSIEDLEKVIKLLEIADQKNLKVYQMPKTSTAIDIDEFIKKLQNKIDSLEEDKKLVELERKNKETLEKMKKNLQF